MKVNEFKETLTQEYKKQFPLCRVNVHARDIIGMKYLNISCHITNDDENAGCNIAHDLMHFGMQIELPSGFDFEQHQLPENMVMEVNCSFYFIKPAPGKNLAFERRNISIRKCTGSAEKNIKYLSKKFCTVREMIGKDIADGNIPYEYMKVCQERVG